MAVTSIVALPIVASPTWTPVRAKLPACDGLQRSLPVRCTVTLVLVPAGWVTIVASTLALPAASALTAAFANGSPALLSRTGRACVVAAAAGVVDSAAPCDDGVDDDAADEPNGPQPAVSSAAASTVGSRAARDSGRCEPHRPSISLGRDARGQRYETATW